MKVEAFPEQQRLRHNCGPSALCTSGAEGLDRGCCSASRSLVLWWDANDGEVIRIQVQSRILRNVFLSLNLSNCCCFRNSAVNERGIRMPRSCLCEGFRAKGDCLEEEKFTPSAPPSWPNLPSSLRQILRSFSPPPRAFLPQTPPSSFPWRLQRHLRPQP